MSDTVLRLETVLVDVSLFCDHSRTKVAQSPSPPLDRSIVMRNVEQVCLDVHAVVIIR